jgi:glycosyltransferase A (GT-A) superfamily protein (DUF2064 family)
MIERRSDCLLMIAARAPHAGATKTRLGRAIGMERAANLYSAFLRDLADRLTPDADERDPEYDLTWTHSPPDIDFRAELRGATGDAPTHVHYVPQINDEDWSARQSALLQWGSNRGYARTILIASDSPQIERDVVLRAFEALIESDVVIGRVLDGGYYLIGQRGFQEIVQGVEMSSASAADGVIDHARELGLRVAKAPETFDVDVEDDLERLREHLADGDGRVAPATWRALQDLGLISVGSDRGVRARDEDQPRTSLR